MSALIVTCLSFIILPSFYYILCPFIICLCIFIFCIPKGKCEIETRHKVNLNSRYSCHKPFQGGILRKTLFYPTFLQSNVFWYVLRWKLGGWQNFGGSWVFCMFRGSISYLYSKRWGDPRLEPWNVLRLCGTLVTLLLVVISSAV